MNYEPTSNPYETGPAVQNSVRSTWLKHLTDDQIREAIELNRDELIDRCIPGVRIQGEAAESVEAALAQAGANFQVEKRVNLNTSVPMVDGKIPADMPDSDWTAQVDLGTVHTARLDTGVKLGNVGPDYGVIQYSEAFQVVDILNQRGDAEIIAVQSIDAGARVRISALLGVSTFDSLGGAPNTLAHLAVFEASHTGETAITAEVFTVRIECFNGMTSKATVAKRKIRHTRLAADRMEQFSLNVLTKLIGEAEAEVAMFKTLVDKAMSKAEFTIFAIEELGGEPDEEVSKNKRTRFENQLKELEQQFGTGNEGAGETAWGALQSFTAVQRQRMDDAKDFAKKFNSRFEGAGNDQVARVTRKLLTR